MASMKVVNDLNSSTISRQSTLTDQRPPPHTCEPAKARGLRWPFFPPERSEHEANKKQHTCRSGRTRRWLWERFCGDSV